MSKIIHEGFKSAKTSPLLIEESLADIINQDIDAFVSDSVLATQKYLNRIIEKNNESIQILKSDTSHTFQSLEEVVDGIHNFILFINSLNQVSSFEKALVKDFKELQFNLLCIFKAILSAYKKQDYFMLCDLLEYELNDNLSQWKILVLSKIKVS